MKKSLLKSIGLFSLAFLASSVLLAQSFRLADVIVDADARTVDVPVYITVTDSAVALQFSIIWKENELRLDTVTFNATRENERFETLFNRVGGGEVRVVLFPTGRIEDILSFAEDTATFTLSFELINEFKGFTELRFNPDYPVALSGFYGNRILATTSDGSISYADEPTATQEPTNLAETIEVYPNPARQTLWFKGFSAKIETVRLFW